MTWLQVDRWRAEPQAFSAVATYVNQPVRIDDVTTPDVPMSTRISQNLVTTLGLKPRLGRTFADADVARDDTVILAEEFARLPRTTVLLEPGRRCSWDVDDEVLRPRTTVTSRARPRS